MSLDVSDSEIEQATKDQIDDIESDDHRQRSLPEG